jgi:hypothetical protein
MKPITVFFHAGFISLAVVGCGKNNILAGIMLGAGVIAFLCQDRRPVTVIVFLLAAFTGFIGEYLSTAVLHAWTYLYPSTIVLPLNVVYTTIPGWIFLFWGYFVIVIFNAARIVEQWLYTSVFWRIRAVKRSIAILAWLLIIDLVILSNVVIGPARYFHYAGLFVIMFLFWRTPGDLVTFYIAAVLATFGEWMCVQRGLWVYPSLYVPEYGVPVTLPLAWGFATLLITRFGLFLIRDEKCLQRVRV